MHYVAGIVSNYVLSFSIFELLYEKSYDIRCSSSNFPLFFYHYILVYLRHLRYLLFVHFVLVHFLIVHFVFAYIVYILTEQVRFQPDGRHRYTDAQNSCNTVEMTCPVLYTLDKNLTIVEQNFFKRGHPSNSEAWWLSSIDVVHERSSWPSTLFAIVRYRIWG